jgi:hypothetical protein
LGVVIQTVPGEEVRVGPNSIDQEEANQTIEELHILVQRRCLRVDGQAGTLRDLVSSRLLAEAHEVVEGAKDKEVCSPGLLSFQSNLVVLLDRYELRDWVETLVV